MTEPRTKAGKALLANVLRARRARLLGADGWRAEIVAVEVEAASECFRLAEKAILEATAAAEQRLRERIEALLVRAESLWVTPDIPGSDAFSNGARTVIDAIRGALSGAPPPASPRQGEPVGLDVMAEPMRAYIGVGAGKPRTEAGRLWHAEWHSGEYPNAPRKCGSMGCGFLGRILGLEYAALSEPAEAGEP